MAKTNKNILGDQSGKIGKVVGRVVNGVQIFSAYNDHNSNPRTPKQLAARARFKAAMRLARALNGIINIGLHNSASGVPLTSPTNIFSRRNNRLMQYDMASGIATPDYEHLILSEGRTPYVEFSNASFDESQSVKVSIHSPLTPEFGAYDDDVVYVAAYCPDRDECSIGTAKRTDATVTDTVPPNWVGKTVYVWGFVMTSVDEILLVEGTGVKLHPGECSPTSYIASGTIA